MITPLGVLPLAASHRISQLTFHPSQPFIALQSHDRSVEIFRMRTEDEVMKKRARRSKREKEKQDKKGSSKESAPIDLDAEISLTELFTPHSIIRASGKVKSFYFPDSKKVKDSIQVSYQRLSLPVSTEARLCSFSLRFHPTPSKSILSPNQSNPKRDPQTPHDSIRLICLATVQTFAHYL